MTSKMMTAYSRLIAKKYLQDTLRDGIEKVCKFKKGLEVRVQVILKIDIVGLDTR